MFQSGSITDPPLDCSFNTIYPWLENLFVINIRASTANVPNAKYLANLAHQTQKSSIIKCSKYVKILQQCYNTVAILTRFGREWQMFIFFFYSSFFLLPSHISRFVCNTSLSLCLVLSSPFLPTLCFVLTPFSISVHLSQIGVEGVEQ